MKSLESVKTALKRYKYLGFIEQLDGCINTGLAQLWGDEQVTEAFASSSDTVPSYLKRNAELPSYPYVLLVTDKGRYVQTFEFKTVVNGMIFSHAEYRHESDVHDVSWAEPNKTRCVKRTTGWKGSQQYFDVVFDGILPVTVTFGTEENAVAFRTAVLNAVKKMEEKAAKKKEAEQTAAKKKETAEQKAAPKGGSAETVKEIRKMYEDGLIDKAEMMELLKAALK